MLCTAPQVFNLLVSSGINLFDTADSYGTGRLNGRSEQLLGRFVDEYPGSNAVRGNVRIATKLAAYPWRLAPQQVRVPRPRRPTAAAAAAAAARKQPGVLFEDLSACPRLISLQWVGACRASLQRTGQERLALAQLHWSTGRGPAVPRGANVSPSTHAVPCLGGGATSPPPFACLTVCSAPPPAANYAPLQERLMWDGLVAVYEAGLVEAVGVSNYGPRQLQRIAAYLAKRGVPLASVQVQYSLLSRGPDQEAVRAACADLGVALIAYSPLALGQFSAVWLVGWRAGCCALEPDGDRMMSAARQGSYEPAPPPPTPWPSP